MNSVEDTAFSRFRHFASAEGEMYPADYVEACRSDPITHAPGADRLLARLDAKGLSQIAIEPAAIRSYSLARIFLKTAPTDFTIPTRFGKFCLTHFRLRPGSNQWKNKSPKRLQFCCASAAVFTAGHI